jgi:hypothetical protein
VADGKEGHNDGARTMLTEIYDWFTEGFDTADLKDAKALLEELVHSNATHPVLETQPSFVSDSGLLCVGLPFPMTASSYS